MFERYTERARRVLFFARYEASRLGGGSIDTEHLLLGLIREGKGLTSRIFGRSHLSMETIRKEIEGRATYRDKVSTSVDIPLSLESKRVLGYAVEEAERLRHDYIGTEHLLLGLMREDKGVAASVLAALGMRLSTVRHDVVEVLKEKPPAAGITETDQAASDRPVPGRLLAEMEGEFSAEITREQVTIGQVRDRLRVQLAEPLLFDSVEATIKPGGLEVVRRLASVLKKSEGFRIEVRGQTDYTPITRPQARSLSAPWELSVERALVVALFLQDEIGVDPRLVGATTCVSYRFRSANTSDDGQRRKPRIEIWLAPTPFREELEPA